jgi:DNA polymerase III epsilon subunit-like protein
MDSHLLRFSKKRLAFTDLETFNLCLSFRKNLPWQATVVTVIGNNIVEEYDTYVKWNSPLRIGKGAAEVTKYDHAKVMSTAKWQEEVFPEIYKRFEEADYIVGHNLIGFDSHLFKEWYKMHGKNFLPLMEKIIDTSYFAKGLKLGIPFKPGTDSLLQYQLKLYHKIAKGVKTRLIILGKEYEIEHDYDNLHNSLCDLRLNVKVWNKMKHHIEI